MKLLKATIFIGFVLSVGSSHANWIWMSETVSATHYVGSNTISEEGDLRFAWELQQLKAPGLMGERSYRLMTEYNCYKKLWRIRFYTSHTKHGAMGGLLRMVENNSGWNFIPPGTPVMRIFNHVCRDFELAAVDRGKTE